MVCLYCNRSWAMTVRNAGPHHWYSLNKTDTIIDFLQAIPKIIIQNFQTSNAASQNNKQRQHQKKTQNLRAREKLVGGGIFPKRKHVILIPSFPHSLYRLRLLVTSLAKKLVRSTCSKTINRHCGLWSDCDTDNGRCIHYIVKRDKYFPVSDWLKSSANSSKLVSFDQICSIAKKGVNGAG